MTDLPIQSNDIVITASLAPSDQSDTPPSSTIIEARLIDRLGEPLLPSFLRLVPSVAVSPSGPAGSLTQVRIRGSEANHTLLFIDGIRVNDPASGNEPRFELVNADLASRIEVVRGPQSALWGSEAVGGVVAVNGLTEIMSERAALTETGSFGFRRAAGRFAYGTPELGVFAGVGLQTADGIDAFAGPASGDRDGYRNLSGRAGFRWQAAPSLELGASALALTGRSQFDGYNPMTFLRDDTLDNSRNRLTAGRIWSRIGDASGAWSGEISASLLKSSNRNFLDDDPVNRTRGQRWTVKGQVEHRFATGTIHHQLIAAIDHEDERFQAEDIAYGGASNQDRKRGRQAITGEWRAETGRVVADIAVRRDRFSRFDDTTNLRASVLAKVGNGFSLAASYGEGIAQPTFFDLYGFFPGSFVGNPSLKPESSRGVEASLRFERDRIRASVTAYRQRLSDEIVDVFDPVTFLSSTANRDEKSRRSGVEVEGGWRFSDAFGLSGHYAFLDATEPNSAGDLQIRELRRARHSGSIAADGQVGRLNYGLSLAYVGRRFDTDFNRFPAERVTLGSYWLAGGRVGYRLRPEVELFARASNLLDQRYEEVFANRTEGRAIHAGIRFGRGR